MAITIPTVDEFTESTVMLVMREIAEYICGNNGLVAQINNNDITGFTSSYTNNVLKIDATKGDGSSIPVCNVTIEGGSSTGNPYPTAVSGTVGGDGNITFTITMSSGSPITTTINMNYFASTADLSDLQEQVAGLALTSSGNTMSINGTSAPIVNSISGSVSNGNLKISVNGVESVDIPLPDSTSNIVVLENLRIKSQVQINKATASNYPHVEEYTYENWNTHIDDSPKYMYKIKNFIGNANGMTFITSSEYTQISPPSTGNSTSQYYIPANVYINCGTIIGSIVGNIKKIRVINEDNIDDSINEFFIKLKNCYVSDGSGSGKVDGSKYMDCIIKYNTTNETGQIKLRYGYYSEYSFTAFVTAPIEENMELSLTEPSW